MEAQELYFSRQDLFQVGTLSKKTVKVIPLQKPGNKLQKVVVGDHYGTLQSFSYRKGEVVIKWKAPALEREISALELGGAHKGKKDKIYIAAGDTIKAFAKNGKELVSFETNSTERVKSLFIDGPRVWTSGDYTMNHFVDGVQSSLFYMATDRINDLTCEYLSSDAELDSVLSCQDRVVRFIQGSELMYDIAVDGPITTLERFSTSSSSKKKTSIDKEFIYGTSNGYIGLLLANNTDVQKGWTIAPDDDIESSTSGIVSIVSTDLTKDGTNDIIIGRDDGSLEVYSFVESNNCPRLVYKKNVGESIQSLDHGFVVNTDKEDIIIGTYSGKIIAFAQSDPPPSNFVEVTRLNAKNSKEKEEKKLKIHTLQDDIEKLSNQIVKSKQKYKAAHSNEMISVVQQFTTNEKFVLNPNTCFYMLTLEANISIDCIIFQSSAKIELEDVDKSVTITSKSPPDDNNQLLATCRVMENNINRIQMKVQTIEGQYGNLQSFVIPRISPKSAQVVHFSVKPLSLHYRINEEDLPWDIKDTDKIGLSELNMTGNFTLSEIHSWLGMCVPDVPEKIVNDVGDIILRSSFAGTHLLCTYKKERALFRSESVSTLSILKEFISKEATSRGSQFNMNVSIKDENLNRVLDMIHPKVNHQLNLAKQFKIIEALKELKMQEEELKFLSPEYIKILENAESIIQQFKQQPRELEFIYSFITELFVSKHKFRGVSVKSKISELRKVLDDYTLQGLKDFFSLPVQ